MNLKRKFSPGNELLVREALGDFNASLSSGVDSCITDNGTKLGLHLDELFAVPLPKSLLLHSMRHAEAHPAGDF